MHNQKKTLEKLKIVHWNCFKLDVNKLAELRKFIDEIKPDILSIQEVKLNQEQANLYLRFDSYSVHYKPRSLNPTKGGGVAVLISDSIINSRIGGLNENLELVGVKIETQNLDFNFFSYYEPKGNNLKLSEIEGILRLSSQLILVGDLNSKTLSIGCKSENSNGKVLEEILLNTDLSVVTQSKSV